ncbi:two-component system response regulator [Pseudoduganella sp. LjRoot289]|uniref:HD-GYP domain-containing protein n=1 Tax=Pseudoduganella sp. LjRoot289 TaxID=3342314 RepID=UPI003ECDD69C
MRDEMNGLEMPTILVVDDTATNLTLIHDLLKERYKIRLANSGEKALRALATAPLPDLVLLDVMMPDMDGYQVLERMKADPASAGVPVIFLTAKSEIEDEQRGIAAGAVDYITKPISPPILLVRVEKELMVTRARTMLQRQNAWLEEQVQARTREVVQMSDATIHAMASLAETRDNETGNHIRRTQHYVAALAGALKDHPRFSALLTPANIELLYKSAPLHDIGKVGVPDRILLKPGKLDEAEFKIMKQHADYGRDAVKAVEDYLGNSNGFLTFAREIAYGHHEKWDGSGYPQGLAGDAIPASARLMAVADVYDALISKRVYKPAFSHDEALALMTEGRGKHFDPDVFDAFIAIVDEFRSIAARYADHE